MATIGKVSAVFTASTSGLRAGVSQAAASMGQMQRSVSGLRGQLATLTAISGAQLFGQIASAASSAVQSLISMGRAQADTIDQTSKLAARLGMTYGELAGLSLAADLAGVSMDTIGKAATKADVAFVKAVNGSQQATAAFEAIGLSVDQLQGMTAAERFNAIADAIAQLPTEAQRSAAAIALFGRSGAELLPLFNAGSGAIAQATAEAQAFGLALTNMQGQNVEAMNDAFTRAQQAINGVVQQVVAYLAPAIENVTTSFSNLIGSVGGATIGQTIGEGILMGARYLAQIGDFVIQNLTSVWQYVSQVGAQWAGVFEVGNRVAAFFMAIGDTLKTAFGLLILGITAPVEGLLSAAQQIGQALGFDTSGLDSALAAMNGFNDSIQDSIQTSATSAARNFQTAFFGNQSDAERLGEAIPGPLTTAIDEATARAREAAAAVDEAAPTEVKRTVEVSAKPVAEAVKGIESRSREGISEMFRLMRGGAGNSVEERQLSALEQIAQNTSDDGFDADFDVVDLAPAAGM